MHDGLNILKDQAAAGAKPCFYQRDGLGSVTEIVDDQGEVIESYRYSPYGKLKIYDSSWNALTASALGNPYFFTGREYDPESGLYYYRARMYSASLGRFLQTDPIGYLDDLNLYEYCANNPVVFIDLFGLAPGDWLDFRTYLPDYGRAGEIAREELQRNRGHNDASDAMRHAEWNRRMREEIGPFTAWSAGFVHEIDNLLHGGPWRESMMDFHNNAEGRRAAREGRPVNPNNLRTLPDQGLQVYPYDNNPCP